MYPSTIGGINQLDEAEKRAIYAHYIPRDLLQRFNLDDLANNRELDHTGYSPDNFGYAVFGRVLSGMEVVDKIAATPTGSSGPHDDVPLTPIVIQKVTGK